MHGIVLFDHLNRSTAVLGDLINISSFEQTKRNIAVPQAIERAAMALPIRFKAYFLQHRVEHLELVFGKQQIRRLDKIAIA